MPTLVAYIMYGSEINVCLPLFFIFFINLSIFSIAFVLSFSVFLLLFSFFFFYFLFFFNHFVTPALFFWFSFCNSSFLFIIFSLSHLLFHFKFILPLIKNDFSLQTFYHLPLGFLSLLSSWLHFFLSLFTGSTFSFIITFSLIFSSCFYYDSFFPISFYHSFYYHCFIKEKSKRTEEIILREEIK